MVVHQSRVNICTRKVPPYHPPTSENEQLYKLYAYSDDRDRPFRSNLSAYSGGSALGRLLTPIAHLASTFPSFPGSSIDRVSRGNPIGIGGAVTRAPPTNGTPLCVANKTATSTRPFASERNSTVSSTRSRLQQLSMSHQPISSRGDYDNPTCFV